MKGTDFFPLGASHAPYSRAEGVPRSEWEKDFINMKEQGLNTISVFAAWDKIETRKGHYDFSDLDHAFALAEKHGMLLSVAIGVHLGFSKHTPRWFMREFKGYELLSRQGIKCMDGNYVQPCFEDPSYNEAAERYIRTLVRRFRNSSALLQWRVWGESHIGAYCTCERHVQLFREYLKKKYKRISLLNQHWGWEGPGQYKSFEELTIPCVRNLAAANSYTEMTDYYDFLDHSMAGTITRAERWVKAEDNHTQTIGEYFGMGRGNHAGDGQNMSLLSAIHDSVGLSLFSNDANVWAMCMDAVSSLAKYNGNEAWTIELQGGPAAFSWQFFNIPSWKKIAMRMWSCVAHESRGIFFWTWRPRLTEFESGEYGMTRLDGTVTGKTKALAKEFKLLQKHAALFRSVKRRVRAAILVSRPLEYLAALSNIDRGGQQSLCKGSMTDCHELLWRNNIAADFLPLEHLNHLNDYEYIFLPCFFAISKEVADKLAEYVKQGGILIADAMLGIKDHQGRCGTLIPGQGLDQVFGFTEDEKFDPSDSDLIAEGKILHAPRVIQTLFVQDKKAKVLAEFDSKPAMILHSYGKGKTLYSGSMLFNREVWENHPENETFLMEKLADLGLRSELTFEPETQKVEYTLLDTGNPAQQLVMVLNHNGEPISGKLQLPLKAKNVLDLRTGKKLAVKKQKNSMFIEIHAEKLQSLFFLINKE